jgi:hypothetical protein
LSVVEPAVFTELGLKEAVVPEGNPVTVKPTVPVKPLIGATVAAYVVLPPGGTVRELGVAETPKSATVTVRVAAVLTAPALSVTVSDATDVPGLEYATFPGVATELEAGTPPGNDQAYAVILPSGSLPDPANDTDPPGLTVTFEAGVVIVAVGG